MKHQLETLCFRLTSTMGLPLIYCMMHVYKTKNKGRECRAILKDIWVDSLDDDG